MDSNDDLLPDSIVQKHLDGGTPGAGDTDDDAPQPAADTSEPDDDEFDIPIDDDEGPDDESEDTDEDEAGDDEPDEEDAEDDEDSDDLDNEDDEDLDEEDEELDDEDDDEEEDDTEDDESETDFLDGSKFSRADIDKIKDPEAKAAAEKAYKGFQASYTKKTQELARGRTEVKALKAETDQFFDSISTPEGAVGFLKEVVLKDPVVAGAAFEQIATGEGAIDFLVEVGLADSERFEKAYERYLELQDDPAEKERHIKDRDLKTREQRAEARDAEREAERRRARSREISGSASRLADKAGLTDEDFKEEVIPRLKQRIHENGSRKGGSFDISDAEIKEAVKDARRVIRKREERVAERLKAKQSKEAKEKAKKRATKRRRPAPARTTSTSTRRRKKPAEVPDGVDPLDHAIDHAFDRLKS